MALAEDLRTAGFFVVEASSADEALDYLSTGVRVDVLFSDIQMPGILDGLALARHCRREYPSVPVILTSGSSEPQDLGGATRFMPKPCSHVAATEAINAALGQNETRQQG